MSPQQTPRRSGWRWNTMSSRILLGLVIGLALGATVRPPASGGLALVLAPLGQLWLDALTMTVVPLVFGLLVTGLGSAASAVTGAVATRAMFWFVVMLIGACGLGALMTVQLLAWWPIPDGGAALRGAAVGAPPAMSPPDALFKSIIPANPIAAAAEMRMVPVVVFGLFVGLAAARIADDLRTALMKVFAALVATMLVIVRWVLLVGPLGVLALGYGVGAKVGVGAVGALAHYVIVVIAACIAVTAAAYGLAALAGRLSPLRFARAALPVQAIALGTQSSLACLPTMIEAAPGLRTSPGAAEIVLPLAVAIFRAASAAANIAVAIYLAHAHGVAMGPAALCSAVVVAAAVSLAAVGLPAQVSFFATIGPVCLALGAPLAALPLLLAVEAVPDIFRTLGNVTSDMAVARIAGRPRGREPGVAAI